MEKGKPYYLEKFQLEYLRILREEDYSIDKMYTFGYSNTVDIIPESKGSVVKFKVAHISDVHLDFFATRLGSQKIVDGVNQYYVERMKRFEGIIKNCIEENVNYIVISGDLHNKPRPVAQEYSDLFHILDRIPPEISVFIITGNHDETTSRGSPLLPLYNRRTNINVFTYLNATELNGIPFVFAPWNTPFEKIKEVIKKVERKAFLVYHVGVTGIGGMNWGEVGDETGTVHIDQLKELNCHGIMLGHHHNQKEISKNIWYAGSPECFNFGERNDTKGYLIWEILDDNYVYVQQIPTSYPRFSTLPSDQFLKYTNTNDCENNYICIEGEVTSDERVKIISKVHELEGCLGVKYKLTMKAEKRVERHISGKTPQEILLNFLKRDNKYTPEQINSFLEIDKKIEKEIG
jgi:DNA repair exonuclease SbcCD nuclease subunit